MTMQPTRRVCELYIHSRWINTDYLPVRTLADNVNLMIIGKDGIIRERDENNCFYIVQYI